MNLLDLFSARLPSSSQFYFPSGLSTVSYPHDRGAGKALVVLFLFSVFTLRSLSSLFSDFSRNFSGVILGGVRDYLGGIWRSVWSCLRAI